MGLLARGLEMHGIATTLVSWHLSYTQRTAPPRAVISRLQRGMPLGRPGDSEQQRRVLQATLALLAQDAPLATVFLNERA